MCTKLPDKPVLGQRGARLGSISEVSAEPCEVYYACLQ